VSGIEKSQDRIEAGQDKLAETVNAKFDMLADSIREIRTVAPRT
jgi:hypothetical protein